MNVIHFNALRNVPVFHDETNIKLRTHLCSLCPYLIFFKCVPFALHYQAMQNLERCAKCQLELTLVDWRRHQLCLHSAWNAYWIRFRQCIRISCIGSLPIRLLIIQSEILETNCSIIYGLWGYLWRSRFINIYLWAMSSDYYLRQRTS